MSSDLVWALTRTNSSFLVKRSGVQLTREPGNLLNKNSFKFSGVANAKAVDIKASNGGVQVTLKKKTVPASKVAKSSQVTTIVRPGVKSITKSVKNIVKGYRPDLTNLALARVVRLVQSQKAPKPLKAKKLRGKAAK
ncbi:hypothetical protein HDU96_001945 [Phlyctochytrium bullatum]|nr:hypothetical protein HDU96_001945 [Phlyctochytrium bullatum]